MSNLIGNVPKDASGRTFNRAMGLPLVSDSKTLGSATKWVDIFNLDSYDNRVFHGIMVENPDLICRIQLAFTDAFGNDKCLSIRPTAFVAIDNLTFGKYFHDLSINKPVTRIRAKLDVVSGTLASGTISYAAIQPDNGDTVTINGVVYEFSNDTSAQSGRILIPIDVSADATWSNLVSEVNAYDQAVNLTIDTGTDIVTVTSNYGGTQGNSVGIADGGGGGTTTGATFSGATLAGGAGGVLPIIHIW